MRKSTLTVTHADGRVETFRSTRAFLNPAVKAYDDYLASSAWKKRRKQHLTQFPACKGCGKPATVVHHRDYESRGHEKTRHLVSLCSSCHGFVHRHIAKTKKDLWRGTASALSHLHKRYRPERPERDDPEALAAFERQVN